VGRKIFSILTCILILGASNCDKEEKFQSCPMTDQIKEDCKSDTVSCVVAVHPQCPDDVCLIYKFKNITTGDLWVSEPFCTLECAAAEDCPADSTCFDYLDKKYCVPNEYLQQ